MRPERLYLLDILEATAAIQRFLKDVAEESFRTSELHQSAVLQKLTTIGEAAARIPTVFRDQYPDIPWRSIVGFRNIAVHEYFAVDWKIVWVAATHDAPMLATEIRKVLAREFPGENFSRS